MSLKRRLVSQYAQVLRFFYALELPQWMTGSAMRATLLIILVASSVAYVLKTSSSVALGYEIKGFETTIAALTAEQQNMAVEVASYRSMVSVQERLAELQMIPVARINHVTPAQNTDVAIAKK